MSEFDIRVTTLQDDLAAICEQMQPGEWGADNEMPSYQPEHLKKFLEAGGILVLAKDEERIAGMALCYVLFQPSGEDSLYVDELHTHPDYRRQGVATGLMKKVGEIAVEKGLSEVWLATEADNDAANAFYKSLNPREIESTVIYTYTVK